MNSFLLAIQFLTIIPVRTKEAMEKSQLSQSIIYFPLVGLLLGVILAGLNLFLSYLLFYPLLINVILVIALIILTGGLHLDGLADTIDAFSSRKDKETLLEIMRDPHIATMGTLSLISIILLKVTILSSLDSNTKNIALIFMCVLSRWSLLLPLYLFTYARKAGKAEGFFAGLTFGKFILTTLVTLIFVSLIWNWKGLSVFTSALIFSYIFNRHIDKRINGVTGDILGATLELNEALILMTCLIITRI